MDETQLDIETPVEGTQAVTPQPKEETPTETVESLKNEISKLRKEAASYRVKLKETVENIPNQYISKDEYAKTLNELENLKDENLNVTIKSIADKLNFHDSSLAVSLLDKTGLKTTETAEITKRLNEIVTKSPFLVRETKNDATATNETAPKLDWTKKFNQKK